GWQQICLSLINSDNILIWLFSNPFLFSFSFTSCLAFAIYDLYIFNCSSCISLLCTHIVLSVFSVKSCVFFFFHMNVSLNIFFCIFLHSFFFIYSFFFCLAFAIYDLYIFNCSSCISLFSTLIVLSGNSVKTCFLVLLKINGSINIFNFSIIKLSFSFTIGTS